MAPASQNKAELICCFLVFGRNGHHHLLRLTGDIGRRRQRGCLRWVHKVIAHPLVPLDHAAVAGAAGGEPWNSLELLSDDLGTVPTPLGQSFGINVLII